MPPASAAATDWQILALLARSLLLTVMVELTVARTFLGARTPTQLRNVTLAQIATNPLVQLGAVALGWSLRSTSASAWLGVAMLEAAAWVAEALLYQRSRTFERPWRASLVMNASTLVMGLVLGLVWSLAA